MWLEFIIRHFTFCFPFICSLSKVIFYLFKYLYILTHYKNLSSKISMPLFHSILFSLIVTLVPLNTFSSLQLIKIVDIFRAIPSLLIYKKCDNLLVVSTAQSKSRTNKTKPLYYFHNGQTNALTCVRTKGAQFIKSNNKTNENVTKIGKSPLGLARSG